MEEKITVSEVATIFANSSVLEENKLQFFNELGVSTTNQEKILYLNGSLNAYDFFYKLLEKWVTQNGECCTIRALCKTLNKLGWKGISEKFDHFDKNAIIWVPLSSSSSIQQNTIFANNEKWPRLLPPSENFVNRDKEYKELKEFYETGGKLVLICGVGGIGKTELCRKFSQDFITVANSQKLPKGFAHPKRSIWLHGDNKETLRVSLMKIANKFGAAHGSVPINSVFESLLSTMFEHCSKLLLVIDNVDEIFDEIIEISNFRNQFENLFVLITSRDNRCVGTITTKTIKKIVIDVLDDKQAEQMLRNSMEEITDLEVSLLCKLLGNFPLALAQAITYIKEQQDELIESYSVEDFIREYNTLKEKKSKMLCQKLNKLIDNYPETVLATWNVTIEKMNDYAKQLLKLLAFFEPDGIYTEFLKLVCVSFSDDFTKEKFNEAYGWISRYSFIKPTQENKLIITIHRIVQDVLKERMTTEEIAQECTKLLRSIVKVWTEMPSSTNKEKELRLDEIRHVLTAWKYAFEHSNSKDCFGMLILETLYQLSILGQFETIVDFSALNFEQFQPFLDPKEKEEAGKLIIWVVMQGNGISRISGKKTKEAVIKEIQGFYKSELSVGLNESIESSVKKYFPGNAEVLLLQVRNSLPPITAVELSKIVEFIIRDTFLLDKWEMLCEVLQYKPYEKLDGGRVDWNTKAKYYDLLSHMLMSWLSKCPKRTVGDLEKIIRLVECIDIAEKLVGEFRRDLVIQRNVAISQTQVNIIWPIYHGVKHSSVNFSGRENELVYLQNLLHKQDNLIIVCGLPGIGKTELCRKFLSVIREMESPPSCIWLQGDLVETLKDSVQSIACKLGVEFQHSNFVDIFVYIVEQCLQNCSQLVVVLDNVDSLYDELVLLIKRLRVKNGIFIIITSRDRTLLGGKGCYLYLDVLDRRESRRLLQQLLIGTTDLEADKLGELVEFFPLALQQAIAYIKQRRNNDHTRQYGVSDYIAEFEEKKYTMLDQKLNKFEFSYSYTTLMTWEMTIPKLSENKENSVEILKIIAFIDSSEINLQFIKELCMNYYLMNDFDAALNLVHKYSIVQVNEREILSHALLREFVRMKYGDAEFPKSLFDAILLLCSRRQIYPNSDLDWNELTHVTKVCSFAFKSSFPFDTVDKSIIHKILVKLLEWERVDCAVELVKINFHNLNFGGLKMSKAQKVTLIEKLVLWATLTDNFESQLANDCIQGGIYEVTSLTINQEDLENVALPLALKVFGEGSELTEQIRNKISEMR